MNGQVTSYLMGNKQIRVYIAETTELVKHAMEIHGTSPLSTAALGRVLTAATIMGRMTKSDQEKVTIQFNGTKQIKSIMAVTDSSGNVKGYISNNVAELPLNSSGKLDVGGAIGKNGKLVIIRDMGLKEPYIGHSNLVTGEIAEDLAAYYMYSEQQPTVVSLGVLTDSKIFVRAAGGIIIQTLPNIDEETLTKLEEAVGKMAPISAMLDKGLNAEAIMDEAFGDFDRDVLEVADVKYECGCSEERMLTGLLSIGEQDLREIIEEDEEVELHCHFCNTYYKFSSEKIELALNEALTK